MQHNKKLEPSKSQLLGWRQDRVTNWIIDKLHSQFRAAPKSMRVESLIEANYRAGQQSVIEVIDKLYDYLPEDSTRGN